MIEIKLFDNNSEDVSYNFTDFPIKAKQALLSDYPNMAAVNHWHDDFEFILVLSNKMSYSVNGNSYELTKGQAIFVNSQQMHYGYSSDGSDCSFIFILIPPLLLSSINMIKESYLLPVCNDSSHPFYIFDPSIAWHSNFIRLLKDIYELCNNEAVGFELQVMSLIYSIGHTLYHDVKNDKIDLFIPQGKYLNTLHNMVGYIQQNYQNKITLNAISIAGNVCRSSCCSIFQQLLHKSPIAYLTEYRLEKSIELINTTTLSMTEIALQCGFNSSSYFTEIFHQKMGLTPSQYRSKSGLPDSLR